MSLCKYKDIFGKPRQGFHSIRVLDIAILDVLGTILIAYIVSISIGVAFWKVLIVAFVLAEFAHWLFCVDTKVIRALTFSQLRL